MKNNFIRITLALALMLIMAIPTQILAIDSNNSRATRGIPSNYSETYNDFIKQFNRFELFNPTIQQTNQQTQSAQRPVQAISKPVADTARAEAPVAPVQAEQPLTQAAPAQAEPARASFGSYEQQVVDLVNKERAAVGLPSLQMNSKLSGVAEKKAEDLRDQNYFAHQSPTYGSPFDMMKQFGISYTAAGENIAKGQRTPESVMDGWMNSPGHKANILNANFTEIGVGYVTDSGGTTYWVQHFIRP